MADVTIAPTESARASNGVNVTDNDTAVSSGNTYYVANNGRVVLVITNDAGSNTLTVTTPTTVDGLAVTDLTATLTASKTYVVGPFPPQIYNDSQGRIAFTVSAGASVMPVRLP